MKYYNKRTTTTKKKKNILKIFNKLYQKLIKSSQKKLRGKIKKIKNASTTFEIKFWNVIINTFKISKKIDFLVFLTLIERLKIGWKRASNAFKWKGSEGQLKKGLKTVVQKIEYYSILKCKCAIVLEEKKSKFVKTWKY